MNAHDRAPIVHFHDAQANSPLFRTPASWLRIVLLNSTLSVIHGAISCLTAFHAAVHQVGMADASIRRLVTYMQSHGGAGGTISRQRRSGHEAKEALSMAGYCFGVETPTRLLGCM